MTDIDLSKTVATLATNYTLYVEGSPSEVTAVLLDAATAGYTPAVGDVLCYKTDDSNKHTRYDETDKSNLVVMGVIDNITTDNSTPAITIIRYTLNAIVHYGALGVDGVDNAAKKLELINLLRAKNIDAVT